LINGDNAAGMSSVEIEDLKIITAMHMQYIVKVFCCFFWL